MAEQQIPGPDGGFLRGSMAAFQENQLAFLLNNAYKYGEIYAFRLGPRRIVVVSGPELNHEVLVKQQREVYKAGFNRNILGRVLGQGILTSEGDYHKRQRNLVQPAFHAKRINTYAEVMVQHTEAMLAGWRDGLVLDIDEAMMRLTMGIVSKTLFDADVADEDNEVGEAIADFQTASVLDFSRGFMLPMWLPTAHNRRIRRSKETIDRAIRRIINERRASGEDSGDLMSMLLVAQDEEDGRSMSDEQVRDEVVTLFAAGHETTSNALAWTWYLLAENPDAEARLYEELDQVLNGRSPVLADLANLPYTEAVIKESMRLYPPVWLLMIRTSDEPLALGGYRIEPGSWIFVSPYITQRDPRYFPNPGSFEPQRFLEPREVEIPRYAYIPFGAGPRVCIGNAFAMMEARLILATIARTYRLDLVPGQEIVPAPEITLSIRDGLRVKLEARN